MLYLDSSAIVKLVAREPSTPELIEEVRADPQIVSSALAWTEVVHAVLRSGGRPARAEAVLERIALVPIDDGVIRSASRLSPIGLRTLDAIHLATALSLEGDIAALVTYDFRLAEAAAGSGLEVRAPGLDPA